MNYVAMQSCSQDRSQEQQQRASGSAREVAHWVWNSCGFVLIRPGNSVYFGNAVPSQKKFRSQKKQKEGNEKRRKREKRKERRKGVKRKERRKREKRKERRKKKPKRG